MQFYTYLHCKPNGDPFYVGKGSGSRSHSFLQRNPYHLRTVEKYGKVNIGIFVFMCESEQQAFEDEIQQIAQLRREGFNLVNLTDGGDGISGFKFSDESRAKVTAALLGRKWSEESIAKRSKTNTGSKRSEETKANMSLAQKGKSRSPELRARLSAANKGKTHTPEARAKISAAHLGKKRALGYRHTAEAKAKIGAASKGKKRTPEHCANISEALKARGRRLKGDSK